MVTLLLLAIAGSIVRHLAPDPSTLRDVGTLLMVLWLPAVGNLVAWVIRRVPRRAPRASMPAFPEGKAFTPHLQAQLEPVDVPPAMRETLAGAGPGCLLLVGGQAFTARLAQPVAAALGAPQPQAIELLRPEAGLPQLAPGTPFHLLVGATAVAQGRVAGV